MDSDNSAFPNDLLSPLASSGFPFQTAVVAALKGAPLGLEVEEEVAWCDDDDSHKFLDAVASHGQIKICIECKALRNDKLVFLLPRIDTRISTDTYYVHGVHLSRVRDSTNRPIVQYGISEVGPVTPESSYCVALGKGSSEARLLEKEAQPLVRGTEQYAEDRCRQITGQASIACIPVLLTTASLFVAEYNPLNISLTDGIYRAQTGDLRQVPFIRFTKQFTSHGPTNTRLRTVVVAQAASLKELIGAIWGNLPSGGMKIAEVGTTIYDAINGAQRRK